jgi:hypothetical protein
MAGDHSSRRSIGREDDIKAKSQPVNEEVHRRVQIRARNHDLSRADTGPREFHPGTAIFGMSRHTNPAIVVEAGAGAK